MPVVIGNREEHFDRLSGQERSARVKESRTIAHSKDEIPTIIRLKKVIIEHEARNPAAYLSIFSIAFP